MVLKPHARARTQGVFENDVKMYGTQTFSISSLISCMFENDVKMYGTQTIPENHAQSPPFENDVKMYGTQTTVINTHGLPHV